MSIAINASRRLRVLQIGKYFAPHRGGMESHLHTLCSELGKHVDVRVLVANEGRDEREEMFDGIRVTRLGTIARFAGAPICTALPRKISESDADLIHIHLPNPVACIAFLASGFSGPLVLTWHSDIVRQKVLGRFFAPMERRIVEHARAIIASSPDAMAYSRILYENRKRCRVIPFGIQTDALWRYHDGAVAEVRKRFRGPLLLIVGRLVGYKGHRHLLRAMKKVDATLMVIGEGPERARLEADVRHLGLAERVVFLGAVDDTSPYYQACDVFVLSSVTPNEAFGIVQLEAMARGKPVVNTQLRSGVPFVSVNGLTGITVPPADSEALARAINILLEDPLRRATYGAAAMRRVQREFSLRKMAADTLALYHEVVGADFAPARERVAALGAGGAGVSEIAS
jgi:glycosyltransferase involved in cell wall biosynthesis